MNHNSSNQLIQHNRMLNMQNHMSIISKLLKQKVYILHIPRHNRIDCLLKFQLYRKWNTLLLISQYRSNMFIHIIHMTLSVQCISIPVHKDRIRQQVIPRWCMKGKKKQLLNRSDIRHCIFNKLLLHYQNIFRKN